MQKINKVSMKGELEGLSLNCSKENSKLKFSLSGKYLESYIDIKPESKIDSIPDLIKKMSDSVRSLYSIEDRSDTKIGINLTCEDIESRYTLVLFFEYRYKIEVINFSTLFKEKILPLLNDILDN